MIKQITRQNKGNAQRQWLTSKPCAVVQTIRKSALWIDESQSKIFWMMPPSFSRYGINKMLFLTTSRA